METELTKKLRALREYIGHRLNGKAHAMFAECLRLSEEGQGEGEVGRSGELEDIPRVTMQEVFDNTNEGDRSKTSAGPSAVSPHRNAEDAATVPVATLAADAIPDTATMTDAELNAELRRFGYDPVKVVANGRAFIEKLKKEMAAKTPACFVCEANYAEDCPNICAYAKNGKRVPPQPPL